MLFVFSLKPGQYKYQFKIFGWTHLVLMLILGTSAAVVGNMYNGLIWFVFPALLIITNDTFAYIFGRAFGKTPLIHLSPKKTWEGFIGGFLSTLFFAFVVLSYAFSPPLLVRLVHDQDRLLHLSSRRTNLRAVPVPALRDAASIYLSRLRAAGNIQAAGRAHADAEQVPNPRQRARPLCQLHRALRRLLCERVQAGLPDQGSI